jgi:SAM-dependent methyltransferase
LTFNTARGKQTLMAEHLFVDEVLKDLPHGSLVLDAGCGGGSFDYGLFPHLRIVGLDIRSKNWNPDAYSHAGFVISDLISFPLKGSIFDFVVCQYVLEHIDDFPATVENLASAVKPGGKIYLSFPNSASFDDRFYRFAGVFAKYGMLKLRKKLEHVQRLDFQKVVREFYRRGFRLISFAEAPSGFSWMNDPRIARFQKGFIRTLWAVKHAGIDLASRSNYLMLFEKTGQSGVRLIFHVCRSCGRHITEEVKGKTWICPFCRAENLKI